MLILWAVLAGISAVLASNLKFETSADSVLHRSTEEWEFYQRSLDLFGGDEVIVVALEAELPFQPVVLSRLASLTDKLGSISGVRRVDSLATVPIVHALPDGSLELTPALPEGFSGSAEELEDLRHLLSIDRVATNTLVSEGGRYFAVNLYVEAAAFDSADEVVREVRSVAAEYGAMISGVPVFRSAANLQTQQELVFLVPITLLLIGAIVFFVVRSVVGACVALFASGVGTLLMLGAMSLFGQPLTFATMILPSTLLAFGCAYSMHFLTAAYYLGGRDLETALVMVARPVALSGLTTAIGFLAIYTIGIEIIQAVALYGAIGVLAVLGVTVTAAPAALTIVDIRPRGPTGTVFLRFAQAIVSVATGRRRLILCVWMVAMVGAAIGLARLNVETDAVLWFPDGSPIRDSYENIRERLSGISPLNIVIEVDSSESVVSRDILVALDGLSTHMSTFPTVGKVVSLGDPLRQIHAGFLGDLHAPLPTREDLVEQYLLMLEGVPQLRDLVTEDRTAANTLLRVNDNGSTNLLRVAQGAEEWWRRNGPIGTSATTTGIMYEFARAEDELAYGQIRGLALALGSIGLIMLLIVRRVDLAVVAAIPNLVPIVTAFGLMGWLGVPLDASTVLLGSLALGVAVDDTIHLVVAFADRGAVGSGQPLLEALSHVLPALLYTTVTVSAGFAVLALSDFTLVRNLGLVTAGLVVMCLVADLTLLPAMLHGKISALRTDEGTDSAQ